MPPKGKGKKRKKGQDLEVDTREEQESPEGRPEINLVIGDVPQASEFQPLQLDQPDDDSDGTNSTGTLHVRLLLLQGTMHVPQACDI